MKSLLICILLISNTQIWSQVYLINLGPTIPGESTLSGYTAYTEIFDVAFNTNYLNKAKPGLLSFRKVISKTSPLIMQELYNVKTIGAIDVVVLKLGNNGQKYSAYKLKNCIVISVKNINDTIEEIEILPTQFYIEYRPQLNTGGYGPYVSYGWNFGTNMYWDGL